MELTPGPFGEETDLSCATSAKEAQESARLGLTQPNYFRFMRRLRAAPNTIHPLCSYSVQPLRSARLIGRRAMTHSA